MKRGLGNWPPVLVLMVLLSGCNVVHTEINGNINLDITCQLKEK